MNKTLNFIKRNTIRVLILLGALFLFRHLIRSGISGILNFFLGGLLVALVLLYWFERRDPDFEVRMMTIVNMGEAFVKDRKDRKKSDNKLHK